MAATAAMVVISAGSMIAQNQTAQKQKGETGKLMKAAQAQSDATLASAPSAADQVATAQAASQQAGQAARKKALAAFGRSDTILTGPRGITDVAPTQRKTLLGL